MSMFSSFCQYRYFKHESIDVVEVVHLYNLIIFFNFLSCQFIDDTHIHNSKQFKKGLINTDDRIRTLLIYL